MSTIIISGKEYKVDEEVLELIALLSKERDLLQYDLQLAGYKPDTTARLFSGELFQTKQFLNMC